MSVFQKAFAKKASKVFDEAKGKKVHRQGKSFGPADVPDGTFTAIVTASTDVPTKGSLEGVPIVRFTATIDGGEQEGKEPQKSFFCKGKPPVDPSSKTEMPTDEQQMLGLLEFLLPDVAIDDIEQVEAALELVNERQPLVSIGVRNRHVEAPNGGGKKHYQDVYFNKLLQEVTTEEPEDNATQDDDSTTGDDDSVLDDDNGASDYVPAVKDKVMVEDKSGQWTVEAVSQSKQTATVKSKTGEKIAGVPWRNLTEV